MLCKLLIILCSLRAARFTFVVSLIKMFLCSYSKSSFANGLMLENLTVRSNVYQKEMKKSFKRVKNPEVFEALYYC